MINSKIISLILLLSSTGASMGQLSGPKTVAAGSTHTYSYTSSTLVSPSWQVIGGSKSNEIFNPGYYSVTVTWGGGPTGGIALIDSGIPVASSSITIAAGLPAPVNAMPSGVSATQFTAAWNAVSGATGYRLDVSTNSSFTSFVTGYEDKSVSALSDVVTGLLPATTYHYRVRATNSSSTSLSSVFTSVTTLLPAPVAQSPTAITASSFTIHWQSVSGASGYLLDVSTNSSFDSFLTGYHARSVTGTAYAVTGQPMNMCYYYRIRAVNASGPSAYSNVVKLYPSGELLI